MAPAWVLLDSCVHLDFDGEDDGSAAAAVKAVSSSKASPLFRTKAIALLGSMKPDAVLADPPGISTFRLLGSKAHLGLGHGLAARFIPLVACADKSLLVLYDGPCVSRLGCYIVFDAASPHLLSTVPPPPRSRLLINIGEGTVALRRQPPSSAYLLADLASTRSRHLPDAELYLWRSDEQPAPQRAKKAVRLPPEACWMPGNHCFRVDTSFSGPGTDTLYWVDLLHGILVCTNPTQDDPELRFIPFPDDCPAVGCTVDRPYRPQMDEFRCAACVRGAIKLVAMVGVLEGGDIEQFRLTA